MDSTEAIDAIRKRMLQVIAVKKLSRRKWGLDAGLSQSHVGQFLRGDIADATIAVLNDLARAAKVSSTWLATGTGTMEEVGDRTVDPTEDYPPALRAILASEDPETGRRDRWHPETIAFLLSVMGVDGVNATPEQWLKGGDRTEGERTRLKLGLAASKVPERAPAEAPQTREEMIAAAQAAQDATLERERKARERKAARAAALVGTPAPKKRGNK